MQLPSATASYAQRVRVGRYVARRLKRAGFEKLAADVARTTVQLKQAGRAWEDADEPEQDAIADRDAADDTLDTAAQEARNALAGRGVDAIKSEPYASIFPDGIGYYTAAPADEERTRYLEFVERLERHLPASDAVRKTAVKAVRAGLEDYATAVGALESARRASSLAGTALDRVIEQWSRQLEKTYGALVAELGRSQAEAFFPKARASRARNAAGGRGGGEAGGNNGDAHSGSAPPAG